jgi:hypothetical protein
MSEPTTQTRAARPGSSARHAGLTRNQWIGVGVVGVAAIIAIIIIKRRQAANAASQTAATTATTGAGAGVGTCPDGSSVDCGGLCSDGSTPVGCDQSGELSTLQTELGQLESALAQGQGGGSGGVSTVPVQTTTPPVTPTPAAGSTTTTSSTTSSTPASSSTTTPAKAGNIPYVSASNVSTTSAKVSWNPASNASGGYSYQVRDLNAHTTVKNGTTKATSVTLTGLKAKTPYNFGVQALPGGAGNNIHFTTT